MSKNIIIGVPALMTIATGSVAYSAGKGAGRLEAKVAAEVTHKAATMKAFDEGYLYGAESIEAEHLDRDDPALAAPPVSVVLSCR